MKQAKQLTDLGVKAAIRTAAKDGREVVVRESRGRGAGALVLRVAPAGTARFYFAYTVDRKMRMVPIGAYGDRPEQFTLERARAECSRLDVSRAQAPGSDLILQRKVERAEKRAKTRKAAVEVLEAEAGTLAALMDAYCDSLQARGKTTTAADIRRLMKLHLKEAFPAYAKAPAGELTRRQAVEVLRRLVEAGKGRTASKMRSYLRAAYALALRAESDPTAPAAMLKFKIESNPIADTSAMPQFNRTGDRALSESEMRALWTRIKDVESQSADALRLALLLGGQRVEQVMRARAADFDPEAGTLILYDPKGRRSIPRAHVLPLGELALPIVEARAKRAAEAGVEWLFPQTESRPATASTVSKWFQATRAEMIQAGEARPFGMKDLRRSCETHLAALGISKDIRAQIQSHGLGGIQARHYDRYDYLKEKAAALAAWSAWLTGTQADNVVPIKSKTAA